MKQTINLYEFRRAFEQLRPDNFTYDGLEVLFEYFELLEEDTGEEMELDVIAICSEYSEDNAANIADQYGIDVEGLNDEETCDAVREYLEQHTCVAGETLSGRIVYADF